MTFDPDAPYKTLEGSGASELVVERSEFLGRARPVDSEDEAEAFVEALKADHYDARHVCYGLRVGRGPQRIDRSNDDGEPARTGGFPIWQVMDGRELTDAICAVVRYFGGVELGTGGLTRAYRRAGREAIEDANVVQRHPEERIAFTVPYERIDAVEHATRSSDAARIVEAAYTDDVALTVAVRRHSIDAYLDRIGGILGRSPRELRGGAGGEEAPEES